MACWMTTTWRSQGKALPDLTFPPREGGYSKGHDTREGILHAALRILIDDGYRALSMRRIASECGLKLGNITYHFPTRDDLVRALLDAVIASYEIEFEEINERPHSSAEARLADICSLIIQDIRTPKTSRVFPELWALSNHDRFVSDRVQDLYVRARAPLVDIIAEIRPDLTEWQRQDLAVFISASMEGFTVLAGHEKPYESRLDAIQDLAIKAFTHAISSFELVATGGGETKPDQAGSAFTMTHR